MNYVYRGSLALLLGALLTLTLTGCASTPGPNSYTPGEAMAVGHVTPATVLSVRQVSIRPNAQTGSGGSLAGAVIGGVAGSAAGGGRGQILTTIGGLILGSIIGRNVENAAATQKAMQVILKTADGRTLSIVQPRGVQLQAGEKVWLTRYRSDNGGRYRVEPRNSPPGAGQ